MTTYHDSSLDHPKGEMVSSDFASTTLLCETGHEVSIALLGPLRDLDQVTTFNWGSIAIAYLYYRLDTVYRGVVIMFSFWHILHVRFLIPSNLLYLLHHFLY